MRKVLSILLAFALCVGFIVPALAVEDENAPVVTTTETETVVDEEVAEDEEVPAEEDEEALPEDEEEVEEDIVEEPASWAVPHIDAAVEAGIVPEFLLGSYEAAITRAEFCALGVALYETVTGSEIEALLTFADTEDVNVSKMATLEVVNGMDDGLFNPNQELTRAQAAAILVRLADALDKSFEEAEATFTDNDDITWAIGYAGQVQKAGIMVGDNNYFRPANNYSRQEAIITINRLFDYINAEEVVEEEPVEEDAEPVDEEPVDEDAEPVDEEPVDEEVEEEGVEETEEGDDDEVAVG